MVSPSVTVARPLSSCAKTDEAINASEKNNAHLNNINSNFLQEIGNAQSFLLALLATFQPVGCVRSAPSA